MAGFLYFIETQKNEITPEDLRAIGLGHLVEKDAKPLARGCTGPDGKPGLVFSAGAGPAPKYEPAKQTWKAAPVKWVEGVKGVPYYAGLWNDSRPTPADLARAVIIAGEDVELGDGNVWRIPVCYSIVRGSTFPKDLVLGEDGETWQELERPQFRKLCADAERVWQAFLNAEQKEDGSGATIRLDKQLAANVCVDALSVNYRLGKLEVSMLAILGTDSRERVLRAVVDDYTVERVGRELNDSQKKSDPPDGTPTADGVTGSSPDTSPPSPT
jgi:hypothetical protein